MKFLFLLLALIPAGLFAENAMQVRKGDRIVFYGDSITEQELYTKTVEAYLSQRYPDYHLSFFNAGWSGDNAEGGKYRLDRDVLALKPTLVTICFGMNDGTYSVPWKDMDKYFRGNLAEIIHRIRKTGARVVLLTPGVVDQENPEMSWLNYTDYNAGGLKLLAVTALDLAKSEGIASYDLHSLMLDAMKKAKKEERGFSLHNDGIHPSPAGHVLMAYALLKALGVPDWHRDLTVDLKSPQSQGHGLNASKVRKTEKGYAMELDLDRLPFFVEGKARKMLPYVPFQEDYNSLKVSFTGLEGGPYVLQMGEGVTSELTPAQWQAGVDLASLWKSPPLKQSEGLQNFVQAKFDVYYRYWRQLAMPGDYIISSPYDPALHKTGILASEKLDLLEWKKALPEAKSYELVLKPAEKGAGKGNKKGKRAVKKAENIWGKKR